MSPKPVLKVALAAPLMNLFDYLPPRDSTIEPCPGQRIRVPFGKSHRIGVLVALADHSDLASGQLRHAEAILDEHPLLDDHVLKLLDWSAHYYQWPPGEVFATGLPVALRRGGDLPTPETGWRITAAGTQVDRDTLRRKAPVQAAILDAAADDPVMTRPRLKSLGPTARQSIVSMQAKGWFETCAAPTVVTPRPAATRPDLNTAQQSAVERINATEGFAAFLLEGVTGSGKTEVYLRCIERALREQQQSLVLVPEIGLTPQILDRFRTRLDARIALMHSGLSDGQRLAAWAAARSGEADIVIGTRSSVFVPLPRAGLIVVDEEHDASFKQQDGFRYSARDLAVWRARELGVPVVLGSATPSFESLHNANEGRYTRLVLPERATGARHPEIHVIDLHGAPASEGLSPTLIDAIRRHLGEGGQVLIYLNRRGFAPVLMCTECGRIEECARCDARLVVHHHRSRLVCHHCGAEARLPETCADCAQPMKSIGLGTERIEQMLATLFPEAPLVRIDRDTTRRRGEIERRLQQIRSGEGRILLGTQMLTKGHDFPQVTLVGIIDADQGLFGTDFRSSERLAQSFIQVAGRAGRADRPGEVYIQTWFPAHPLLRKLLGEGYGRFAEQAMDERRDAGWPPFAHLALLRVEAPQRAAVYEFLDSACAVGRDLAPAGLMLLGPAPAPMERRSGRYRGQLMIHAESRAILHAFVARWRGTLDADRSGRKVRWSIDVDPVELF